MSDPKNEMILRYDIGENINQIKILGDNFVEMNKLNCKLIIDNKEQELISDLNIENIKNKNLTIKLIETKPITDMSYMFSECKYLSPLSDLSKWDTSNVTDMNNLFSKCYFVKSLPDISNWNTSNVKNMGFIFFDCYYLLSLPNISKWNISNVIYLNDSFRNCSNLIRLPDISKWNTINIGNMYNFFVNVKNWKLYQIFRYGIFQKLKI